ELAAGSVRRSLETLVAEGKVIRSENQGGYAVHPKALCWSTPEMEGWRNRCLVEHEAKEVDERTRLSDVAQIFKEFGVDPGIKNDRFFGRTVTLTLEDAEKVAARLKGMS